MEVKIRVKPSDAYEYFISNIAKLYDEMIEIGRNDTTGYSVYLTEFEHRPWFTVTRDDITTYEEGVVYDVTQNWGIRSELAEGILKKIYTKFLYPVKEETSGDSKKLHNETLLSSESSNGDYDGGIGLEREDLEIIIEDRDLDLRDAVCDMINSFSDEHSYLGNEADLLTDEEFDEVFDSICILLAAYGLSVYRPMFVTVGGKEVYSEHPFNEYDLADCGSPSK